jgi:hypothetical protein
MIAVFLIMALFTAYRVGDSTRAHQLVKNG